MPYKPVVVDEFPGLDYRSDVLTARAIAATNVDIDLSGKIGNRDGYTNLWSDVGSTVVQLGTFRSVASAAQGLIVGGGSIRAVDNFGSLLGTAAVGAVVGRFAQVAAPNQEYVYYSGGTGATTVLRWDGVTFTSPAGLGAYSGTLIAATPIDDRLVIANHDTAGRLIFSNAGQPESITYGSGPPATGNYVDVGVGKGEKITEMAVWRDSLIVFQPHRFFVFYGTTVDATGNPVFNYRTVDVGQGAEGTVTYGNGACVAHDGVYFINRSGVWHTTGDAPVRVSRPLGPYETGLRTIGSDGTRVYASDSTQTFVYHTELGVWTRYGLVFTAAAPYPEGQLVLDATRDSDSLLFGTVTRAFVLGGGRTLDSGQAINGLYQLGWSDLGVNDQKVIRQVALEGSGTVTLTRKNEQGVARDDTVTMFAPGFESGQGAFVRKASRARLVSLRLTASGVWSVSRITLDLRDSKAERV